MAATKYSYMVYGCFFDNRFHLNAMKAFCSRRELILLGKEKTTYKKIILAMLLEDTGWIKEYLKNNTGQV